MDLLPRARNFDLDALALIYDQYSQGLYLYAMRLLGSTEIAEECVSETFSRLLKALSRGLGPRDHLKAYLYRSAHNWITDYYRSHRDIQELDEKIPDGGSLQVGEQVELRLEHKRLRSAISKLSSDQRQVVALHFIEGWELTDIAVSMGKSVGAVKALQHRALANLGKILKDR
ncbi:MAG: RNA polymerase sigma factor [Bellilinea sp.]